MLLLHHLDILLFAVFVRHPSRVVGLLLPNLVCNPHFCVGWIVCREAAFGLFFDFYEKFLLHSQLDAVGKCLPRCYSGWLGPFQAWISGRSLSLWNLAAAARLVVLAQRNLVPEFNFAAELRIHRRRCPLGKSYFDAQRQGLRLAGFSVFQWASFTFCQMETDVLDSVHDRWGKGLIEALT